MSAKISSVIAWTSAVTVIFASEQNDHNADEITNVSSKKRGFFWDDYGYYYPFNDDVLSKILSFCEPDQWFDLRMVDTHFDRSIPYAISGCFECTLFPFSRQTHYYDIKLDSEDRLHTQIQQLLEYPGWRGVIHTPERSVPSNIPVTHQDNHPCRLDGTIQIVALQKKDGRLFFKSHSPDLIVFFDNYARLLNVKNLNNDSKCIEIITECPEKACLIQDGTKLVSLMKDVICVYHLNWDQCEYYHTSINDDNEELIKMEGMILDQKSRWRIHSSLNDPKTIELSYLRKREYRWMNLMNKKSIIDHKKTIDDSELDHNGKTLMTLKCESRTGPYFTIYDTKMTVNPNGKYSVESVNMQDSYERYYFLLDSINGERTYIGNGLGSIKWINNRIFRTRNYQGEYALRCISDPTNEFSKIPSSNDQNWLLQLNEVIPAWYFFGHDGFSRVGPDLFEFKDMSTVFQVRWL